jgi:predicted AlkP superfamily pyrophosphatase or phosphodiesterase
MKIISLISIFLFIGCEFVYSQKQNAPKLVVGIVVDQMSYEYLYRYQAKFQSDGFKRLMEQGTNCRNTQYNYVPTYTGPGHAAIYTGTTPSNNGIVGNEWYDRSVGKVINCVSDITATSVGTESDDGKCSPSQLISNTITDQLKLTYPSSKVISISIKDRSAILPGGHMSDASYWYDYATGRIITSSFYMKDLPRWVERFNEQKQVENYMRKKWIPLLNIKEYTESGPDNSLYEGLLPGKMTPTFPYDLKDMSGKQTNYSLFTATPFANTYLTDFALKAIDEENLGSHEHTDMLCISYSSTDIAGHTFGPYSVEIEDMYLRLDLEIAKLIKTLEDKLGKDEFVLFLTADHGVVPVPQYLMANNLPGGYVFKDENVSNLSDEVKQKFNTELILEEENHNIYLDREKMKVLGINRFEVESFVAEIIRSWKGVKAVYTSSQLVNPTNYDELFLMVQRGYDFQKSGDVIFVLNPGYLSKHVDTESARKGTSHGSPYGYDTHVPLLWYGKNIPQKEVFRKVNITDITPTLIYMMDLQKPNATSGEPILEILGH